MSRHDKLRVFRRRAQSQLESASRRQLQEPPALSLPGGTANVVNPQIPLNPLSSSPLSDQPPESSASSSIITDETGNPLAQYKLDPNGLWFTNYKVASAVGDAIRTYYNGPYTCWTRLPAHDRHMIWKHFRAKFKWDAEHAQAVFMEFKCKSMKRLTDTANKAAKRPADHLPSWLSPEVHFVFPEAHSDPNFEKRSITGKANRRKLGDGVGTDYQGSMSTAELVKKMTDELGRVPTLSEVYLRSRSKKRSEDSNEVLFIDDRCSQAWDKFQELRTLQEDGEGSQEGERSPSLETELFLEAIGSFLPSGTVLGLGSATHLFYEKPIRVKSSSVTSTQSRAVTDLKEQIEIQARLLEEANRRAEADRAAHAKELEETKKQMETKLEGNMQEMKELKRIVREMMVNLTPSMRYNPFTGSETQPPSQH